MKLLGIFTFNFILAAIFTLLGMNSKNQFINNFLHNQILPISATLIGFNVTGVFFLIGYLLQIPGEFTKTMKEIKHNIYIMGIAFITIVLLLFINPLPFENFLFDFLYQSFIMTLFFIQIFAVSEIVNGVISLKNNNRN